MAKPKTKAPLNFIDLRQEALKRNGNLIDDIIRPMMRRRKITGRVLAIAGTALVIVVVICLSVFRSNPPAKIPSPVPANISTAVNFPVYFPDPAKLPAGYTLDKTSFSSGGGAVEFTVLNAQNQKLVFTEQTKPSTQDLQQFVTVRIPLHNTLNTPVGTATIGAISNNAFVSLPTNSSTWILVSAPYAINQTQLATVLKSLTD